MVKREPLSSISPNRTTEARAMKKEKLSRNREDDNEPISQRELRAAKREKVCQGDGREGNIRDNGLNGGNGGGERAENSQQNKVERRVLRSRYLAVKNLINDEKEELYKPDSDKFNSIIKEVENLHEQVQKPREQVADAEALLDIANTLVATVRSQSKEGVTPSDFIACLIRDFGGFNRNRHNDDTISEGDQVYLHWKDIGLQVSPIFKQAHGCFTMIGPMKTELKQRKVSAPRTRRTKPTEPTAKPEELSNAKGEEKTDTDKNMAIMFNILRKNKSVRLESLIINRSSFAQTIENLFALSFLVKDGRAEIVVDDKGNHRVSPKNAPGANLVASGEVVYQHFVFRFDFKDWKLMKDAVPVGQDLMPHRDELLSQN